MSDWTIYLEYRDAKSSKFWRGKAEGGDLHVNYGRIGSAGQTKVKTFASPDDARAELDKVANQKRKKGYADAAGGSAPAPAPAAPAAPAKQSVTMTVTRNERPVELTVTADGDSLTTTVSETFTDAAGAAACYERIVKALVTDGYTRRS